MSAGVEAVVNPVNCVGRMGRGLAMWFRGKYPDMFRRYASSCAAGGLKPGDVQVMHYDPEGVPAYIINLATKGHWRNPSEIGYIVTGITNLHELCRELCIKRIALPALGCGLGNLPFSEVSAAILKEFEKSEVEVLLYEPLERSV